MRQLVLHWTAACVVTFVYLLILQVFTTAARIPLSEHLAAMWTRYGVLLVVVLTLFPVFLFDSLRVSHRFAGPMVSFRDALAKLARGERIPQLEFRQTDFWRELAGNLNAVASKLGQGAEGSSAGKSPS